MNQKRNREEGDESDHWGHGFRSNCWGKSPRKQGAESTTKRTTREKRGGKTGKGGACENFWKILREGGEVSYYTK